MINPFYNKKIGIAEYSTYKDEHKINRNKWTLKEKNIVCDIQPYSEEQAIKDYGFKVECTNRAFLDINESVKVGNLIIWNTCNYEIKKIIRWDTYAELILFERDDLVVKF